MDLSESHHESPLSRSHPWEIARARFFVDTIAPLRPARVLDVGSGDGFLVKRLLDRLPDASALAWDTSYTDDDVRALTAGRLTAVRTLALDEAAGSFDVALLLDVLEHVEDDASLLRDVARLVRPGGFVVMSVPAWPGLLGAHDMQLRHLRRYTPAQARSLLQDAGLCIERSGGLFLSLIAPRAVEVSIGRRLGRVRLGGGAGVGDWSAGPIVTAAVSAALRLDTLMSRALAALHLSAPGLSFWAVARR